MPRDRILDDLWPDTPPDQAWPTFRTVYSRLRRVLEPHFRPKAPSRYFAVDDETYTFDPLGVVWVDVEELDGLVRRVAQSAAAADVPPLPPELLTALEHWQPILPDLPYADRLLGRRQRWQDSYVEGCLYVAQTMLQRGQPAEAVAWAERTLAAAPWLEEAHQALMRGYARLGQRGLALRAFQEAVRALSEELNSLPSPLTLWVYDRLQRGEYN